MGSPFKMKPKSPMMKALVGKQGNLPQHLQDKIKAAPESPAKSYGSKTKSPVMQKETKGKKKFGEADAETRERQSIGQRGVQRGSGGQRKGKIGGVTVKAKVGKERGATDLLEVAKDSYSKAKKYVKGKLGIPKVVPPPKKNRKPGKNDKMLTKIKENYKPEKPTKNPDSPRNLKKGPKLRDIPKKVGPGGQSPVKKKKMSQKAAERKQRKGKGFISRKIGGKSQDATFTKFTRKGRKQLKETGKVSSDNMKLNKSTPIKKKGVKALEAQRGTKNPSPIKKQHLKKKDTKGNDGSFGKPGTGMQRSAGQRKFKVGGVTIKANVGKTRGATDLYKEGKKLVKSLSSRGKGSGARARKRSRS